MKRLLIGVFTVSILLILAACSVSKEDIDKWGAAEGKGYKLKDVVLDTGEDLNLRSYALVTIIKTKKIATLEDVLKEIDSKELIKVLAGAADDLGKLLNEGSLKQQAMVKDALFLMMERKEDKELRSILKDVILTWYEEQFPKKMNLGRFPWSTVLEGFGPDAADFMAKLMDAAMRTKKIPSFTKKLAELIKATKDEKLIAKADALIAARIAKEYPNVSEDVIALTEIIHGKKIVEVFNRIGADPKVKGDLRLKMLENMQNFEVLEPSPNAMLMRLLTNEDEFRELRIVSLAILRITATKKELPTILKYANNPLLTGGVLQIMAERGGPEWVMKFFGKVKQIPDIGEEDYRDISSIISVASNRARLRKDMLSLAANKKAPTWQRAVALLVIKRIGKKADAAAVKKLTTDKSRIKNYKYKTIGELAKEVHKVLEKRKD